MGNFLKKVWMIAVVGIAALGLSLSGCGYEPDTSAPERAEIQRSVDWQGALLYVADAEGPTAGWGSVRIYDNVSGVVETTVEQTMAAAPADMHVTPDGGRMYVASSANGRIDSFSWNGDNWLRSGPVIDTPGSCLSALKAGPDGKMYATDCSEGQLSGRIFVVDLAVGAVSKTIIVPDLISVTGISWSPAGDRVYLAGTAVQYEDVMENNGPVLEVAQWPSMQKISGTMLIGLLRVVHQVEASPDGQSVYVMGLGEILKLDEPANTLALSFKPDVSVRGSQGGPAGVSPSGAASTTGEISAEGTDGTDYVDAAFSADARYLFVTGGPDGNNKTNVYVIDLITGELVQKIYHAADDVGGIQRVE